jgi:hypothetical protein
MIEASAAIKGLAALLFGLAIVHTFLVKYFRKLAHHFEEGSVGENFFHLLGEVEIVFGLWAALLLVMIAGLSSPQAALAYLDSRNFSEPAFVFVILAVCSTQPVLDMTEAVVSFISQMLPLRPSLAFFVTTLTIGPILGSFITEPAAMAVTAYLLLEHFYQKGISLRFKYATLGVLFVNISVGGTLTPFAAPAVLMVASKWGWGLREMFFNFGWKGALACLLSTGALTLCFRDELGKVNIVRKTKRKSAPLWVRFFHLLFLVGVVVFSHHLVLLLGLFLFFLGFVHITNEYQEQFKIKEGLLVSFFLAGLVVLGGMQTWWLDPILSTLTALPLYLGAMGLTAFTDNAALTYLGSLVPTLSESSRYALVAGAVVGGGLTVIANAPNPVGYSILQSEFGDEGISPAGLLLGALPPTIIAAVCFWFL